MRNRSYGFEIYLVNVKTIRTIEQIFVTLSEKLNFILFGLNLDNCNHATFCEFLIKTNVWRLRTKILWAVNKHLEVEAWGLYYIPKSLLKIGTAKRHLLELSWPI